MVHTNGTKTGQLKASIEDFQDVATRWPLHVNIEPDTTLEKEERVGNRINRNTGKLQRKGQKPVSSFRFQSEEHNLSIYIFMMRDNNKNQYVLMH